jgi:hypothetical protein
VPSQSSYALSPDVPYTFHIPYPDEGKHGIVLVSPATESVEVHTYNGERVLEDSNVFCYMTWEEKIREMNMVITPLLTRAGTAVRLEFQGKQCIGCLIPLENSKHLLHADNCSYHALVSEELDMVELFFIDVLRTALIPVGEILYLNMQVMEEERFRSQGAGGKVLFTRLNVPHVRKPETGKLYVTCLYQPRTSRGKSVRSAVSMTLAVNPWDVVLPSLYSGSPSSVLKHLQ